MYRTVSGIIAAMVLASTPALAQGLLTSGEVGLDFGFRHISSDDDGTGSYGEVDLGGVVSIPVAANVSLQLDAQLEWYSFDDDTEEPRLNALGGGHISYRDPNSFLVGVFGGYSFSDLQDDDTYELMMLGLEGQYYADNVTLYAQAGYADKFAGDSEKEGYNEGWFLRGEGRYFVTDDSMVSVNLFVGNTSTYIDGNDDGRFFSWGLSGKTRLLDQTPLYGTLAYRGAVYDSTTEDDILREHVFLLGISYLFGATSLLQADRSGATLSLPMTPVRANGFAELID